MINLTSVKGNFSGNEADCLSWLEEMQPGIVSAEIAGLSESLDVSQDWPQALRSAVVEISTDIDGGEPDWQQYLCVDAIADVIAEKANR